MTNSPIIPKAAPGPWVELANCAGLPADLFFPSRGDHSYAEAKAVCRECVVREDCLAYALTPPLDARGIWGGMSERERRRHRETRRTA